MTKATNAANVQEAAYPLGAPDDDRPPLKASAFESMRTANSKLTPMFGRYLHKGAMVPAVACFTGAPGRSFQMFKHENCVEEIATVFGAQGAPMAAGAVMQGAREHFVNIPMNDKQHPSNYVLIVVTQRQWEKPEPQWEKLTLVCEQCQEPLIEHKFTCDPSEAELRSIRSRNDLVPFATLVEGVRIVEMLTNEPERLVCKECGFSNKPFPLDDWGWNNYAENAATVSLALSQYPTHATPASAERKAEI
jgi:hypothetical protein